MISLRCEKTSARWSQQVRFPSEKKQSLCIQGLYFWIRFLKSLSSNINLNVSKCLNYWVVIFTFAGTLLYFIVCCNAVNYLLKNMLTRICRSFFLYIILILKRNGCVTKSKNYRWVCKKFKLQVTCVL